MMIIPKQCYLHERKPAEHYDTKDTEADAEKIEEIAKFAGFGSIFWIPTSWSGMES